MALLKGFDPSKQAIVKKGFHEGGRKYVEGDLYSPRSKVGKSKVLFRHFVARRIEFVEPKPEVSEEKPKTEDQQTFTASTKDPVGDYKEVKKETSTSAPKRRGRKKKEDDVS